MQNKLLLISGGCLVGQNILDVLQHRRQQLALVATNSDSSALPLAEYDRVYLTATTCGDPEAFESQILQLINDEAPDLVIPCRDDDVLFLATLGERYPDLQPRLLVGNYASSLAMVDKAESWFFSQRTGLPFAPSLVTPLSSGLEAFAEKYGFPLLAKPRYGFAAHGVFFILNMQQLQRAATLDNYVIQRFLGQPELLFDYQRKTQETGIPLFHSFEGIKHSIEIFIGPKGEPLGNFCSRNVNRNGTSLRLQRYLGEDARALGEQCQQVFAAAGWRGPINIQCQQTPQGDLQIYEYNSRITGATAARYHMGYDEMGLVLKHFLGLELMGNNPAGSDVVWRKALDVTCQESVRAALDATGVWSAI